MAWRNPDQCYGNYLLVANIFNVIRLRCLLMSDTSIMDQLFKPYDATKLPSENLFIAGSDRIVVKCVDRVFSLI